MGKLRNKQGQLPWGGSRHGWSQCSFLPPRGLCSQPVGVHQRAEEGLFSLSTAAVAPANHRTHLFAMYGPWGSLLWGRTDRWGWTVMNCGAVWGVAGLRGRTRSRRAAQGSRHPLWHHADRYWVSDFTTHFGRALPVPNHYICETGEYLTLLRWGHVQYTQGWALIRLNTVKVLVFDCRILIASLWKHLPT